MTFRRLVARLLGRADKLSEEDQKAVEEFDRWLDEMNQTDAQLTREDDS